MLASNIHCDFYEIVGPDWNLIDDATVTRIIQTVEAMELLGREPDLNGFVGTARLDNIVGGFFALQYEKELLHYDASKRPQKAKDSPYERLFFVFFAKTGKLVLQNRKFVDLPLNMEWATRRFSDALNEALRRSEVRALATLFSPGSEVSPEVFQSEFSRSERIYRLRVESPDPAKIPAGFVYYNPEFDRNSIIRESHQHDYPNFRRVDLESHGDHDLKGTHLANDLIQAGVPVLMKYRHGGEDRTLRRSMPRKFEIYVDVDVDALTQEILRAIVQTLRMEIGLPVDIVTTPSSRGQLSLFGLSEESDDEEDQ